MAVMCAKWPCYYIPGILYRYCYIPTGSVAKLAQQHAAVYWAIASHQQCQVSSKLTSGWWDLSITRITSQSSEHPQQAESFMWSHSSSSLSQPKKLHIKISNIDDFFNDQVKSSSGATRPRGDHPDLYYLFLPPALRGLWQSDWGRPLGGSSAGRPAAVTGPAASS